MPGRASVASYSPRTAGCSRWSATEGEIPPGQTRDYNSYCGNYIFDGTRLVTRVDAASDPSRIGGDQMRGVRFEGERMILSPPPRATGAGQEHRELTWEKIAAE